MMLLPRKADQQSYLTDAIWPKLKTYMTFSNHSLFHNKNCTDCRLLYDLCITHNIYNESHNILNGQNAIV